MFRRLLAAAALLLAPSLAHADWHEASSKHFVVYADQDPAKLKTYTERLERFDQTLRFITGTPDKPLSPNLRVHVYVLENVREIQKLYGSRGPAGFYEARATGPVAFVPQDDGGGQLDAQTILQHEYGHSFMFSSWPSAVFAKWFVEGFAEFVGTAFFKPDGTLVIGEAPAYRAYGLLRTQNMPASRLLKLDPKDRDLDTQTLYGRGWLLTHYSLLGGHTKELVAYIRAVNEGKSIDEANKAFGGTGALDGQLDAYARRPQLPVIRVTPDKVPVGEVSVRKLTPGEAATMNVRIYSQRGVDDERAKMVVEWARKAAAPFPNDPGAQNALAEAEFDAKNYPAAEAAADRAIAADPKSVHALLYKGMAQMEIAKAAKETDAAKWKSIRAWFVRANKLDTEYPQPLILFYQTFVAAGQEPPESAQNGILGAYVLAPYDERLRAMAGKVLLQQNNLPAARIAFEPLAYGPHQATPNMALDVLNAIDSGGAPAALKVIADAEAKAKAKAEEDAKRKAGGKS